ncbi:MAG: LLM class flavin-dependent oxidoreductase, partial [Actinobacteria bacterium]|nr:LLM class flavin-dependent oxidoreductase [Actinomycetota bacterium]
MRFALLLEAPHPRPWTPTADGRRIRALVDAAVRAEALGFHRAWVPEHHLQEERHHGGPPEALLGAIATRTRRLGLGLGPVLAHPAVQHPVRLAAAIAALDALSGGRSAVAFADPRAAIELGAFGIARAGVQEEADRLIERVARLLAEAPFLGEHDPDGLPVRQLVPRPQGRPHPALWRACDRPADVRVAAEGGLGAFVRTLLEPDEAAEWAGEHRAVQRGPRCRPLGAAVETGVAVTLPVHVAEDPETALREGLDAVHLHLHLRDHHERFGAHRPGRTRALEEFGRLRATTGHDPAPVLAAPDGPLSARVGGSVRGAIGDPDQVVELLARYRDAGVDEIVLVPPLGLVDADAFERSMVLLGREVLPRLADDEDDDLVEGEDPAIEAALRRRRPAPAPRETVVLPREDGPLDDVPAPAIGMGSVSGAVAAGPEGAGDG